MMNTIKQHLNVLFLLAPLFLMVQGPEAFAVEFFEKSYRHIQGQMPEVGLQFEVRSVPRRFEEVTLHLYDKTVLVHIIFKVRLEGIRIYSFAGNEPGSAAFAPEDYETLQRALSALSREDIQVYKIGKILLRTLNLLDSWPDGFPVALSGSNGGFYYVNIGPAASPCDWPPQIGLSPSICDSMNQEYPGEYLSSGWLTPISIGPYGIYYPLSCAQQSEIVGPYPYESGECYGRCGRGCIGDGWPDNGLNVFTQNCFNHDLCVEKLGLAHPYCMQMFLYCIGDFYSGTDCEPPVASSWDETFGEALPDGSESVP